MEFETTKRVSPTINLSALIDIAFILVIFVVLAASFDRMNELKVSVPQAESTGPADPKSLVVTVPAEGAINIDGARVPLKEVRPTLESLKARFDGILLVADQSASVQRAVQILGDAQAVGFESVGIATKPPQGGQR